MAAMPATQGLCLASSGTCSMARSKSSARSRTRISSRSAGDGGRFRALLFGATLEVGEIGAGALPAGLGLGRALLGGLQLGAELGYLLAERGRAGVEGGDTLLGTGATALGGAGLGLVGLFGIAVGAGGAVRLVVHVYR
jgi:hypothetical protein